MFPPQQTERKEQRKEKISPPPSSSQARLRKAWSLVVSIILESQTEESASRAEAVPEHIMLQSAMAASLGSSHRSLLLSAMTA